MLTQAPSPSLLAFFCPESIPFLHCISLLLCNSLSLFVANTNFIYYTVLYCTIPYIPYPTISYHTHMYRCTAWSSCGISNSRRRGCLSLCCLWIPFPYWMALSSLYRWTCALSYYNFMCQGGLISMGSLTIFEEEGKRRGWEENVWEEIWDQDVK